MNLDTALDLEREPHGSSDDPTRWISRRTSTPRFRRALRRRTARRSRPRGRTRSSRPSRSEEAAAEYVDCDPDAVVPTPGGLAAIRAAIALAVDPGTPP